MSLYSQQFLALKASAGSGKTFALTIRYISLLFANAHPNEILTLTFTKKATLEMSQRIKTALFELANLDTHPNSSFAKTLIQEGFSKAYIQENAPKIYATFLESSPKIMTIDAFINSVLRKFCWYIGLRRDYENINTKDYDRIYELFLQNLSKDPKAFTFLAHFCVEFDFDFKRFMSFLEQCHNDKIYFSDTFLRQYKLSSDEQKNLESTIATLKKKILQDSKYLHSLIAQEKNASSRAKNAIKTDSFKQALGQSFAWLANPKEYPYFTKLFKENPDLESSFIPKASALKEEFLEYYTLRDKSIFCHIAQVLSIYNQAKDTYIRDNQSLSFDDCTIKAYELLALGKDVGGIDPLFFYFRMDNTITHILIDEFQDTNTIQFAILKPLIDEIYAGIGQSFAQRSVFFVGDVKQSIYGFRGSESGLFEQITADTPHIHTKELPHNYRSYGNVIDFVNTHFKEIFSDSKYTAQSLPKDSSKQNLGFVNLKLESDPLQGIITSVKELLDSKVSPNDIAILCYKNDDIFTIRDALEKNLPSLEILPEMRAKLTDTISVREILSALKFLHTHIQYKRFYLYEFYKLIGYEVFSLDSKQLQELESRLCALSKATKPSECILAIMNTYKIYDKNAQLFLECSIGYESIAELLDNLDSLDINAPKENLNGLRILTIHASKGLEFEYVILCDRLSGSNTSSPKIIYPESLRKDSLPFIYISNREAIDEAYNQAKKYADKKTNNEKNNVLYVACTRGKKGLIIIARKQIKGDRKPESAFQSILQSFGILDSKESTKAESSSKDIVRIGEIIPSSTHPTLSHNTPNILKQQDFGRQEIQSSKQESLPINIAKIRFGQAVHLGLEYMLGYGIDSANILHLIHNHFGLDAKQREQILNRIEKFVCDETFQALSKDKKIFVEVPLHTDSKLMRLDVLAQGTKQICVFDYKSGIQSQEKHDKQVREYITTLQHLYAEYDIKGYIIYIKDTIQWREVKDSSDV